MAAIAGLPKTTTVTIVATVAADTFPRPRNVLSFHVAICTGKVPMTTIECKIGFAIMIKVPQGPGRRRVALRTLLTHSFIVTIILLMTVITIQRSPVIGLIDVATFTR
jgi:hypothetical protein